jgi:hypothetical protein
MGEKDGVDVLPAENLEAEQQLSGSEGSTESPGFSEEKILEVVNKALETTKEEIARSAVSQFQSLTDKAEQRMKEDFKSQVARLERTGVQLSAEQRESLLADIKQSVMQEEKAKLIGETSNQQQQSQPETSGWIEQRTKKRMVELHKKYGTSITQGDPEVSQVFWESDDPYQFMDEYEAALQAKADRVKGNKQEESQSDDEEGANIRLPHAGTSASKNQSYDGLSALDLLSKGFEARRKNRNK